jgi:hypothetical protein
VDGAQRFLVWEPEQAWTQKKNPESSKHNFNLFFIKKIFIQK